MTQTIEAGLRRAWGSLRRDEQCVMVGCTALLLLCAGHNYVQVRTAKPLPPLFVDAPLAAGTSSGGLLSVHVAGAVHHAGVYRLQADACVADAITAAGGLRADAFADDLNLAARVRDGEQIRLSTRQESRVHDASASPHATDITPGSSSPGKSASHRKPLPPHPIAINLATADDLQTLPGVGPTMAQRILDYRHQHGPLKSVQDLHLVKGIGPKKLEKLRPYVRF